MRPHAHTPQQIGPERAYQGGVAQEPETRDNRRAHGNITYTERCTICGAERLVNANQGAREYSPWSTPMQREG